jgi:hypothetical protein
MFLIWGTANKNTLNILERGMQAYLWSEVVGARKGSHYKGS